MRLAYGAGALAAASVMSVGLVHLGSATTQTGADAPAADATQETAPQIEVRHLIRYVHLKPGEVAPPGATVITPKAPAPQVVVTHVAAPANTQPVRRIVVTRQSGHP
jgi:hypothetical protein